MYLIRSGRLSEALASQGKEAEFSKMKVGPAGGLTDEAREAFNEVASLPVWDALEPVWDQAGKAWNKVPMPGVLKGTSAQASSKLSALIRDDSDDEDGLLLLEDGDDAI